MHGVGGILGTLLTAVFAVPALGAAAVALWAGVASFVILKVVSAVTGGLRVSAEVETEGLDVTVHGEHAYDY